MTRDGDPAAGLAAYAAAGRITTLADADSQRAALVAAWWQATRDAADPGQTVMLAHRRADVAELNRRAPHTVQLAGRLTGPVVYGTDEQENPRCFAVGDLVILRRNDHRRGLINGQRGTVAAVDPPSGSLRIDTGDRQVTAGRSHLMAGVLEHGYALTVHQAQGLTVDRALPLGTASLYREAGYVGLSRARHRTDLILAEQPDDLAYTDDDIDRPRQAPTPTDPMQNITRTLQRSKAQRSAHDLSR